MIDVHCHLNFHSYAKDYDQCIHDAKKAGVTTIINVGTKLDSSEKAVALAGEYDDLYAIVGVHPHHADKKDLGITIQDSGNQIASQARNDEGGVARLGVPQQLPASDQVSEDIDGGEERQDPDYWLKELEKLAKQPKVVAIGEIGLDYFRYQSNGIVDPELQKEIFEAQIQLAYTLGLPIQIHNRHAGKDVLEILKHHKNLLKSNQPGMFHCFAGDMNILKGALNLGFYIGFDGNLTYPGLAPGETTSLSDLAKATPLDRIVTETDSPFLTPIPHRGSRNAPERVILVGRFLATLKNISEHEMDQITTRNAQKLFSLPTL